MDGDLLTALGNYDFVRFTFVDINGISRCKLLSKSSFKQGFTDGEDFYVGSIGFGLRGELNACGDVLKTQVEATVGQPNGNMTARPVPNTLHPVPYVGGGKFKVGQVFCETFHSQSGMRQQELPRYMARKMIEALDEQGLQLFSGFELEFYLLDPKTLKPAFNNVGEMFTVNNLNQFDGLLMEAASTMEKMGVEVHTMNSEYCEGQFELVLKPQFGLKIADNVCLAKDCIREVARRHNLKAVFMTKRYGLHGCNGMHFSHSLRKVGGDETSVFSDVSGVDKLSPLCRSWLGGLVHHFPALNTICSPTVNCYRRLGQDWAPCASTWGLDNRLETYRVKNYSPKNTYIESRLPSGSANPYLVLAATVAAGLDGIKSKLPCPLPEPHSEPTSDVYTHMEASKIPRDLAQALEFLEQDAYLISALGSDFVKWFSILKREELDILKDSDVKVDDPKMFDKEAELYMDMV